MPTTLEHPPGELRVPAARLVTGVLDIDTHGKGHLRAADLLPTPADPQVPAALIRRYGLRKGDPVEGARGAQRALTEIARVEGRAPGDLAARRNFRDLTPLHPRRRLRLEHPDAGLAGRVADLFTPVGKGQRGLLVAPPKSGKTVLLRQLAAAVAGNHPGCRLMVLLLDEGPEEVTEMRRTVHGEVYASTFDRTAKEHIALADLVVERAKRLVEAGEDVVVLLDSLTRLCRAHNNASGAGGRTLSGGVDAGALIGPKRFFGAAREAEEGGSLTIIATALVETGSKMDEVIYEEFKGTGNSEVHLDRRITEKRVYPAIGVNASGTRREDLLIEPELLQKIWILRKLLHPMDEIAAMEFLLDKMKNTKSNDEFFSSMKR